MKNFTLSLLLVIAIFVVGCVEPTPEPTPEPPVEKLLTFDVNVTETTKTSMSFSVTPSDMEADYFVAVYDVPYVDDFTKDEYLVSTIFEEIAMLAAKSGLTFEQYMAANVDRGVISDSSFTDLAIDKEYYLLVFGVDATNGYDLCSEVSKTKFKTDEAPMVECVFDVVTNVYLNTVTFDVMPSDKSLRWHLMTMPKAMYDEYTDPNGDMRMTKEVFYHHYFQNEINQMLSAGYSEQQVIDALMLLGDKQLSAKGLNANTEYIYLIAGVVIDSDGLFVATSISEGVYTSGEAAQSDMTFNIEVWDIEAMYVSVRITPSNNDDIYCALIQPWDGHSTAVEVMNALVNQWGAWMQMMANDKGVVEHSGNNKFKLDAPDTDYYVIAFGYEGGVTTAPEMVTFRSLPSDIGPEKATFNMVVGGITPYGFTIGITTDDPTVFYTAGAMDPAEWNEEELVVAFNENFDMIYEQSKAFDAMITRPQVVSTYYWNGNQTLQASGLKPNTEVMGYLVTIDSKTGYVAKVHTYPALTRTASLGSVAPTIELVGYYSGDEEAGSIFDDPEATAGKAITVVEYGNLEEATALYSTMVMDDCASETSISDADLWSVCMNWWNTIKLVEPYSFFVADWEVEQTVVAYAKDANGVAGALGRLYTKPTAQDKGALEELQELIDELYGKTRYGIPASLVYGMSDVAVMSDVSIKPTSASCATIVNGAEMLPEIKGGVLLQLDKIYRVQRRNR